MMKMIKLSWIMSLVCYQLALVQADDEMPAHFDAREQWKGCAETVVDQGQCGSCWAASATSVFGDRACIWYTDEYRPTGTRGAWNGNRMFQRPGTCTGVGSMDQPHRHGCKRTAMFLSPQPLISCGSYVEDRKWYPSSAGCNGGEAVDAWKYFYKTGVSEMTADGKSGCTPNTSVLCKGKDPKNNGCRTCSGVVDQCVDSGDQPRLFKVGSFGHIMDPDLKPRANTDKPRPKSDAEALARQIQNMMVELYTNGPIHVCIDYFDNFGDFFNDYPLGIYNSTDRKPKSGGHCLNLIGWGHDDLSGLDYWLIKNSWGDGWGDVGVFRMIRGIDLAGVESDVWAGCPMRSNCNLTPGVNQNGFIPEDDLLRGSAGEEIRSVESRRWPAGHWMKIAPADYLHFKKQIAHAYESTFGETTTPEIAIAAVRELWTQGGVKGTNVRVDFDMKSVTHHHAHDGKTSSISTDPLALE